jgi:hypothetical protein
MADIGVSLHNAIEVYKKNWQKMLFAAFLVFVPLIVAYAIEIVFLFSIGYDFSEKAFHEALFSKYDYYSAVLSPFVIMFIVAYFICMFLYLGYLRYQNLCFTKEPKLEEIHHFLKYRKLDTILFFIIFSIVISLILSPLIIGILLSRLESVASIAFMFFLLIVCCLAMILFSFSHIAFSIEDLGPDAAIKRSFNLVKENYFTTILFFAVFFIIFFLIFIVESIFIILAFLFALTIILIPVSFIIYILILLFNVSFGNLWMISFYREMAKSQPQRARVKKVGRDSRDRAKANL